MKNGLLRNKRNKQYVAQQRVYVTTERRDFSFAKYFHCFESI